MTMVHTRNYGMPGSRRLVDSLSQSDPLLDVSETIKDRSKPTLTLIAFLTFDPLGRSWLRALVCFVARLPV